MTADYFELPEDLPPVPVPQGHVGPVMLPGTGRMVWWTGRVAIGLRYEPPRRLEVPSRAALQLQQLMIGRGVTA